MMEFELQTSEPAVVLDEEDIDDQLFDCLVFVAAISDRKLPQELAGMSRGLLKRLSEIQGQVALH